GASGTCAVAAAVPIKRNPTAIKTTAKQRLRVVGGPMSYAIRICSFFPALYWMSITSTSPAGETLIGSTSSGLGAGPSNTAPVTSYTLRWQGQRNTCPSVLCERHL